MTKHLRFLIVLLMTLVWSTGGAQTTIDFTTVKWNNGYTQAPFSFKGDKGGNTNNGPIQNITDKDIRLYAKNKLTVSTTGKKIVKIVFTISTDGKKQWAELTATTGSVVADKANTIATWENVEGATSVTFTVGNNCKYGTAATTKAGQFFFKSVDIYELSTESDKTPTKVAFPPEYSNKTFTFTEGKLEGFTAPTAAETNNVAGTITYSSDNVTAVKVNASTGALSFPGYGEATITATFTPTDAEKYKESSDSYMVVNNNPNVKKVTFIDTIDKGKNKNNTAADEITKEGITIYATKAAFGYDTDYRFYKGSNINISTTVGTITRIEFTSGSALNNLKGNGYTATNDEATWTGNASNVVLTNNSKVAKAGTITVYVSLPSEITLDETATNTLVAKTGVNVTLKRSMVENEWNTICLPFNVTAEQAKTAFGEGVMIAQLNKNSSGNKLSFSSVDAIVASTPYLIKPTIAAPADGYKFEGVTINDDGKGNVAPNVVNTNSYLAFVGIYNTVDVTNNVIEVLNNNYYAAFLGANNTIFKAKNDGGKMKGFRAYFAIPNNVAASALCVMVNGTTTSIKSINGAVVESNAPVYNLQGQRVDGNNLTPGIYVKAGKKFVVR